MEDVVIIGAGAAGLSAGIHAARNGMKVNILEKDTKPANKILATGGGKCNYTNTALDANKYFTDPNFINSILYKFDASDAISFFETLGVISISRSGYVYPRSEEASTIRDALLFECDKLGVTIRNNTEVKSITKAGEKFSIKVNDFTYLADKVIIATGGQNASGNANGYELAKTFGHKIEDIYPALTSITTDDEITKADGVRCLAKLSFMCGSLIFEETGELQILKNALSGIPVMNNSKYVSSSLGEEKHCELVIDFLPDIEDKSFKTLIDNGARLDGFLPKRLASIIESSGKDPKAYKINITGVKGFEKAQVTHGGVATSEINSETMESKLVNGLYFAGEVVDIDGICGGYNLHFAWASGAIAGFAASNKSYEHIMPTIEQLRRWENMDIGSRRSFNE